MSNYVNIPSYGDGHWRGPVVLTVQLPVSGNNVGDVILTEDTNTIYVWNGSAWIAVATPGAAIAIDGLLGDVTATGPGVVVATIQPNVVTNTKLAQMPALTIKGNNTGGTANAMDLTVAQVNTMLGDVTLVGTIDSQSKSANGLVISGNSIFAQTADASFPGMLSLVSQAITGQKTFSSPILIPDGTVSLPGIAFSAETSTGLYRPGASNLGISVLGSEGIDLLRIAASQVNIGIGIAAMAGATNFFTANRAVNNTVNYNFGNTSAGTSSATVFQISNGPSSNYTLIENWANTTAGYLAGGSALFGNPNQLFLNLGSEISTGSIRFNVGGRTLATERMRLNPADLTLNAGISLKLNGATSGTLTLNSAATTSSYSLVMPSAQGAAFSMLQNDGSGNLSFAPAGSTNFVTKTANYSITATDSIIYVNTNGGGFTLTLPNPTAVSTSTTTKIYRIVDINGTLSTNNLTLAPNGAEKIEGLAASKVLQTDWGFWQVTTNNVDWFIG